MRINGALSAVCALAFAAGSAWAQPLSQAFTYQGSLYNSGAQAGGWYDLRFRLYDAAAGGNQLGATLCFDNVAVAMGVFMVQLDFGPVYNGQRRFVEIDVRRDDGLGCADDTGFVTLATRQELTLAPYASFALSASTAVSATDASTLAGRAPAYYSNAANLSGGPLPGSLLQGAYANQVSLSNTLNVFAGSGAALTALNASNLASGTVPAARLGGAYTNAVSFLNATNGFIGTFSGSGTGLTSLNASSLSTGTVPDGRLSGTYSAVLTLSNVNNTVYGGFNGSGAGLTQLNASNLASGTVPDSRLSGTYTNIITFANVNNVLNGSGAGLTSLNATNVSSGLLADARLTTNIPRLNAANAFTNSATITANAGNFNALQLYNNNASTYPALYVENRGGGPAGYFQGSLSASSKLFIIDHPDDPENKYLMHSCVESNERMNVYAGTAVLDGAGEADISLPSWFESLNRNFSYQLTPIGRPAPGLYVAQEISGGHFRVAGGSAGMRLSWMVTGVRQDAYAKAHPFEAEADKGVDRGKYLNPELFGQGPEKGGAMRGVVRGEK